MSFRKSLSRSFLAAAMVAGLCLTAYTTATATEHGKAHHWGYEGEAGPANWGHISEEYATCAKGKSQSPIDISGAQDEKLADIAFNYKPSKINIVNNGHTVQVNYDEGSSIKVNGSEYKLLQFHFHDPSEHTVGGKSFGMELHLVHKNDKGELAVVGVLIEKGKENPAFKTVWANIPKKAGEHKELKETVNASDLLPASKAYFTYSGSLTTPPCSEGVTWLVLKTPVQLSEAQINAFMGVHKGNNRPVQPLNSRKIRAEKK
ncbi:MAG TPA: carbonic anhydrase family protein [Thermodesulfobacteriota bacterium]|nr:carbonic anhydrase family protein [Thermodesulfobacteriota bacterium]